jgi:hypothetical protein
MALTIPNHLHSVPALYRSSHLRERTSSVGRLTHTRYLRCLLHLCLHFPVISRKVSRLTRVCPLSPIPRILLSLEMVFIIRPRPRHRHWGTTLNPDLVATQCHPKTDCEVGYPACGHSICPQHSPDNRLWRHHSDRAAGPESTRTLAGKPMDRSLTAHPHHRKAIAALLILSHP